VAIQHRGSNGPGGPGKGLPTAGGALDEVLAELERKMERVRTFYEQYFMGIERMEPQVARKDVARTLLLYSQMHIRNTGQRFRFHSLQQKWNIYVTLWNRTLREIEAGTYRRDVARVTRKLAREGVDLPEEAAIELGIRRRERHDEDGETHPPGEGGSPALEPDEDTPMPEIVMGTPPPVDPPPLSASTPAPSAASPPAPMARAVQKTPAPTQGVAARRQAVDGPTPPPVTPRSPAGSIARTPAPTGGAALAATRTPAPTGRPATPAAQGPPRPPPG
jgi:hypothetical protein